MSQHHHVAAREHRDHGQDASRRQLGPAQTCGGKRLPPHASQQPDVAAAATICGLQQFNQAVQPQLPLHGMVPSRTGRSLLAPPACAGGGRRPGTLGTRRAQTPGSPAAVHGSSTGGQPAQDVLRQFPALDLYATSAAPASGQPRRTLPRGAHIEHVQHCFPTLLLPLRTWSS